MENLCVAFSQSMMDDQKLNIEGVSAIQSAESKLDLTRLQTCDAFRKNNSWKNNRGEAGWVMLCASGNKEIHSTQRTIDEVQPTQTCRQTTVGMKWDLERQIIGVNKQDASERHKERKKKPKDRWMSLGRGPTKEGCESDARPLMAEWGGEDRKRLLFCWWKKVHFGQGFQVHCNLKKLHNVIAQAISES